MTLPLGLRNRWDTGPVRSELLGVWAAGRPALSGHGGRAHGHRQTRSPRRGAWGVRQTEALGAAGHRGRHLHGLATCTGFLKPSDGDSSS